MVAFEVFVHLSCILSKFFILSLCPLGLNSSICRYAHIGNIIVGMNRGIFDFWQSMMFMVFVVAMVFMSVVAMVPVMGFMVELFVVVPGERTWKNLN